MNKTTIVPLFLLFLTLIFPNVGSTASIIPEDVYISFQNHEWETGRKMRSLEVGGVTVAAKSKKVNGKGARRYIYQSDLTGMGIRGGKSNGIDGFEKLLVNFDEKTTVSGVWIADLFGPNASKNKRKGEMGRLIINDGEYSFDFYGRDSDAQTGEQYVDFGEDIYISKAVFKVLGGKGNRWQRASDFWVVGFTQTQMNGGESPWEEPGGETGQGNSHTAPVPEPATMLLMGVGLAGLAVMRRKKK